MTTFLTGLVSRVCFTSSCLLMPDLTCEFGRVCIFGNNSASLDLFCFVCRLFFLASCGCIFRVFVYCVWWECFVFVGYVGLGLPLWLVWVG